MGFGTSELHYCNHVLGNYLAEHYEGGLGAMQEA